MKVIGGCCTKWIDSCINFPLGEGAWGEGPYKRYGSGRGLRSVMSGSVSHTVRMNTLNSALGQNMGCAIQMESKPLE